MKNLIVLNLILVLSATCFGSKPNVLYISIDDYNNWAGYLKGHPQVKTPNIDRLVARGIAFTNAHCTTPLCKPSRTAILTGLSETKTNVYGNGDKFNSKKYKLLPQYFADHNYITGSSQRPLIEESTGQMTKGVLVE